MKGIEVFEREYGSLVRASRGGRDGYVPLDAGKSVFIAVEPIGDGYIFEKHDIGPDQPVNESVPVPAVTEQPAFRQYVSKLLQDIFGKREVLPSES